MIFTSFTLSIVFFYELRFFNISLDLEIKLIINPQFRIPKISNKNKTLITK